MRKKNWKHAVLIWRMKLDFWWKNMNEISSPKRIVFTKLTTLKFSRNPRYIAINWKNLITYKESVAIKRNLSHVSLIRSLKKLPQLPVLSSIFCTPRTCSWLFDQSLLKTPDDNNNKGAQCLLVEGAPLIIVWYSDTLTHRCAFIKPKSSIKYG